MADLFCQDLAADDAAPERPEGLIYRPDVVTPNDEAELVARFADLPFQAFQFRGYEGRRRIVSYGWRYDFSGQRLDAADAIPDFLRPLRAIAAPIAGLAPDALAQTMITEYAPGAPIGWHRDRPVFDKVIGASFLTPCILRFRRRRPDGGFERLNVPIAPRSVYVLSGPARSVWEHSIAPLPTLRYSVTFRTFNQPPPSIG